MTIFSKVTEAVNCLGAHAAILLGLCFFLLTFSTVNETFPVEIEEKWEAQIESLIEHETVNLPAGGNEEWSFHIPLFTDQQRRNVSLGGSFSGSSGSIQILIYTGSNKIVYDSGAQREGRISVPLKSGGNFRLVAQNSSSSSNSMTIYLNSFSEERNSSKENALRQQVEREEEQRRQFIAAEAERLRVAHGKETMQSGNDTMPRTPVPVEEKPIEYFPVFHHHPGANKVKSVDAGFVVILPGGGIQWSSEDCNRQFVLWKPQIVEVKANSLLPGFHIKTIDGQNFNFVPMDESLDKQIIPASINSALSKVQLGQTPVAQVLVAYSLEISQPEMKPLYYDLQKNSSLKRSSVVDHHSGGNITGIHSFLYTEEALYVFDIPDNYLTALRLPPNIAQPERQFRMWIPGTAEVREALRKLVNPQIIQGFRNYFPNARLGTFEYNWKVVEIDTHAGPFGIQFADKMYSALLKDPTFKQLIEGLVLSKYETLILRMEGCVLIVQSDGQADSREEVSVVNSQWYSDFGTRTEW